MRKFDLIVFDWDGTIVDSTSKIAACIQSAAADLQFAVPTVEQARHVIGLGLIDALAHAVPGLPRERVEEFSARFRHHYLACEPEIVLFEGMQLLLADLASSGVPLAVATGKARRGLERAFEATGLGRLFAASRCADESQCKPDPAMLLELASELNVTPERMLMIGDTTHDLQMAAAAGAAGIGVTYGAHGHAHLVAHAPLLLANSVAELREWLLANALGHDPALIEICESAALTNGGRGVRFEVDVGGRTVPAFAIRYGGRAYAYLNRCAHVATELDWQPGMFFDFDAEYLLCSTHGAMYDATSGACVGGACLGHGGLRALQVVERDGRVMWQPDGYAVAVSTAA